MVLLQSFPGDYYVWQDPAPKPRDSIQAQLNEHVSKCGASKRLLAPLCATSQNTHQAFILNLKRMKDHVALVYIYRWTTKCNFRVIWQAEVCEQLRSKKKKKSSQIKIEQNEGVMWRKGRNAEYFLGGERLFCTPGNVSPQGSHSRLTGHATLCPYACSHCSNILTSVFFSPPLLQLWPGFPRSSQENGVHHAMQDQPGGWGNPGPELS